MEATLNPLQPEQHMQQPAQEASQDKSELMQFFENHVNDAYWAYKDLLKAILDKD